LLWQSFTDKLWARRLHIACKQTEHRAWDLSIETNCSKAFWLRKSVVPGGAEKEKEEMKMDHLETLEWDILRDRLR